MDIKNFYLHSKIDELPLSVMLCENENPRGVVQLCHGMSEYKERYAPFISHLCNNGYVCIIHDHRGHGASVSDEKGLGHFSEGGYNALIEDIHTVNSYIRETYNLPVAMFGHSMGSLAVRAYAKRYDSTIDALIVCGSPSENKLAGVGKSLAKVISSFRGDFYRSPLLQALAFGSFNKKISSPKSPNSWICSDESIVLEYDNDPLCGFVFTANGFINLFELMGDVYNKQGWSAKNPSLPICFVAGEEDPCITNKRAFESAVAIMGGAGYSNITHKLYPNMRHEILNEFGKLQVFDDIVSFLDKSLF